MSEKWPDNDLQSSFLNEPGIETNMSAVGNFLKNTTTRRGVGAIVCFVIIWHIGAMIDDWTGVDVLGIGLVPPPGDVFAAFLGVIPKVGYWMSWGRGSNKRTHHCRPLLRLLLQLLCTLHLLLQLLLRNCCLQLLLQLYFATVRTSWNSQTRLQNTFA